ncbi:DUF2690 domain-containing protein [Bacillus cereus group sp. BfR-BA-01380]|uniref:DUF2690 domain-containing protein n=1 Tax=Bacillus cereus group sp. BfR-BA-01380 TaxID=2920324 RepID=UPI001F56BB6B|nr:DUF2690 domain-containing protein [Bacillus cereus group sp. BfR-BA-01380]
MGKYKKIMLLCFTFLISLSSMFLTNHPIEAATFQYDGTDPETTGCAKSATTVQSLYLQGATLELRYSSSCRTAWAKITAERLQD